MCIRDRYKFTKLSNCVGQSRHSGSIIATYMALHKTSDDFVSSITLVLCPGHVCIEGGATVRQAADSSAAQLPSTRWHNTLLMRGIRHGMYGRTNYFL